MTRESAFRIAFDHLLARGQRSKRTIRPGIIAVTPRRYLTRRAVRQYTSRREG